MQRVLGIDLGTTNSVVAYVRRGEPVIVPNKQYQESTSSVVARGRRGELLVGASARGQAGADEANVIRSIKRFMGRKFASPDVQAVLERVPYEVLEGADGEVHVRFADREYTPTEISSLILARLKAEAEDQAGVEFPRAVITVPAYFGERQVAATREAGRMAGFHVLKVLDEPTAAALAYGYIREESDDDPTILVFDLGGGTFDISVLLLVGGVFTVLCVEGDNLMGGDDFDRLIVDRVVDSVRSEYGVDLQDDRPTLYKLIAEAERAKIALSAEQDTEIILPGGGSVPISVVHELSRDEFTELIRARIDAAMGLVSKAVAGADLEPADIDRVLLVGGSTAIPYVEERLAAMFGAGRIRKDVHPMKSVALGAAIQGSLVSEIECARCLAPNPVSADDCGACSQSLMPPPKVACAVCFLLADAGTARCPKCGTAFGAPPPPVVMTKAPADPTEGGLRCLSCGVVNAAGALVCSSCHEPVERPLEITAQDLGIELHDGRMAVILPKNTAFPTPEDQPIGREFATAVTDQRRLEIVIHEGPDEWALRNELCGYLTLALPPGLPRNSPIHVAFGLDASRMITVSVRVRALGEEPRRVQIQHSSRLDPEDIRRLEKHRRSMTKFVDRWTSELFPAESSVCYQMIGELEEMIAGSGVSRDAVNEMASRADRLVETVADARGQAAYVSAVQASVGKYIAESDRVELEGFASGIESARERADCGAALVVGRQAEEYVAGFGPALRTLVFCRTFAVQGKLSPALSHRVMGTVREFDSAFDRGDSAAMDQALAELVDIHDDVNHEMNNRDDDVVAITKPGLGGV